MCIAAKNEMPVGDGGWGSKNHFLGQVWNVDVNNVSTE